MTIAVIAGLAVFGTLICGFCVKAFITFMTVRDVSPADKNATAMVAVAWVTVLALIAICVMICVAIGYLGFKP